MTEAIAVFSGILCSTMLLMNGKLSTSYGNQAATVFIHLTGLFAMCVYLLIRRQSLRGTLSEPWQLYLGGVIGVFTVIGVNLSYTALGVSVTLVLSLFGQVVTSLAVDGLGILGAVKTRFHKKKLVGVGLVAAGAALMLFF